ncbi:MAG: hypothetical protein OHK0029_39730 [Armatimonadaceae bacterium]
MNIEDFLPLLDSVKDHKGYFTARCPAHDDRNPSLSITTGGDGRILLKCQAGCYNGQILAALGLEFADLFAENPTAKVAKENRTTTRVIARYVYADEAGKDLYRVCRTADKRFFQERPDGRGRWMAGISGVRRVPYRLPEILTAVESGDTIFVVEGEKDAENLRACGFAATCNSGGAGKWLPEFAPFFRNANIVIIPDNDQAGHKHAEQIAANLYGVAASVKKLALPDLPLKGDLSDWLKFGGTKETLLTLVEECALYAPSREPRKCSSVVKLADVQRETVEWFWRGYIPRGKIVVLSGDPGLGKTTLAGEIAARISRGEPIFGTPSGSTAANVLFISLEDGLADTIRPRLEAAGADLTRVFAPQLRDENGLPRLPILPDDFPDIADIVRREDIQMVVIDPIMAALSGKVDSHKDQDVRRVLAQMAQIADETGATFLVLRHLNKAAGGSAIYRGQGSIGITGASRAELLVAKDPDDENARVLASVKSNLGKTPNSLKFRLRSVGDVAVIGWEGESLHTADSLVTSGSNKKESALDEAMEFLEDILADGPVPAKKMVTSAENAGISPRTLRRARMELGVRSVKSGFGSNAEWQWDLPKDEGDGHFATPLDTIDLSWHTIHALKNAWEAGLVPETVDLQDCVQISPGVSTTQPAWAFRQRWERIVALMKAHGPSWQSTSDAVILLAELEAIVRWWYAYQKKIQEEPTDHVPEHPTHQNFGLKFDEL